MDARTNKKIRDENSEPTFHQGEKKGDEPSFEVALLLVWWRGVVRLSTVTR